jgi:hypothetical protein
MWKCPNCNEPGPTNGLCGNCFDNKGVDVKLTEVPEEPAVEVMPKRTVVFKNNIEVGIATQILKAELTRGSLETLKQFIENLISEN